MAELICWQCLLFLFVLATNLPQIISQCSFNPMCTCLNPWPNLGKVQCLQVPLASVPQLNGSHVHELTLGANGLRFLDENRFTATGISSLQINQNWITRVPEGAFLGLERSLLSLDLSNNRLHFMPYPATIHLSKLQMIDLSGNLITDVRREDFRGLENSLSKLLLANNYLTHVAQDAFVDLKALEVLDLSNNGISYLHDLTFKHSPRRLTRLLLAGNLLSRVPIHEIAPIAGSTKEPLLTLDLNRNSISSLVTVLDTNVSLHKLLLEDNAIESLPSHAFRNFHFVGTVSLRGNPLKTIQDNAFQGVVIQQLDLSGCDITEITEKAFNGLEPHLETLDLSNNRLHSISADALKDLQVLTTLSMSENSIRLRDNGPKANGSSELLDGIEDTLRHLSVERMGDWGLLPPQKLRNLTNLQTLHMSELPWGSGADTVNEQMFHGFGTAVKQISLRRARIKAIGSRAFLHVAGLQKLDLSDNSIETVSGDALEGIEHSLKSLQLSAAFSPNIGHLPAGFFTRLNFLTELDASNNRFVEIPKDLLHQLPNLEHINLQDNKIASLTVGIFDESSAPKLQMLRLSFNILTRLSQHTFCHMNAIKRIYLNDNAIQVIESAAFGTLPNLEFVNLEGNKLTVIDPEAFQYLPNLSELNLAYNYLQYLNLSAFEQVGTLSKFSIDCSHNHLAKMVANDSASNGIRNIAFLNFSHNNISAIDEGYLQPVRNFLISLDLSHNSLSSPSDNHSLGHLPQLNLLLLDNNHLDSVQLATKCPNLRMISLSNNNLTNEHFLNVNPWQELTRLDLSGNRLQSVPVNLFKNTSIEHLAIADNLLGYVPGNALPSGLRHLDLSGNQISSLSRDDFAELPDLSVLRISRNRLTDMDIGSLARNNRLVELDISHNPLKHLAGLQLTALGALQSLEDMNLANVSWQVLPSDLKTASLLSINLSSNGLSDSALAMPPLSTAKSLQEIDLSNNSLKLAQPSSLNWHAYTRLHTLRLSGNPITTITNQTFRQLARLRLIDISHLPLLREFQSGSLSSLPTLQSLAIGTFENLNGFSIANSIATNEGLQNLTIVVSPGVDTVDKSHLVPRLPLKLSSITITGDSLKRLGQSIFQGVQSRKLSVEIAAVEMDSVGREVFEDMGRARSLHLTVGSSNGLGNPMGDAAGAGTFPGGGSGVFVRELRLIGNRWKCDCNLGWIEPWMRRSRQLICEDRECGNVIASLRDARCDGRSSSNSSVMAVLKEELECGWGVAKGHRSVSGGEMTAVRSFILIIGILIHQHLCHLY